MGGYIPDWTQWMQSVQGWPPEYQGALPFFAGASNFVFGGNPPFTASDLLTLYPQFFGTPLAVPGVTDGTTAALTGVSGAIGVAAGQLITGPGISPGTAVLGLTPGTLNRTADITEGTNALTNVSDTTGCAVGQPIAGTGIPDGTTLTAVGSTSLMLSQDATATADGEAVHISTLTLQLSANTTAAGAGTFYAYTAALAPLAVLNAYIGLASGSLVQARWGSGWYIAMGWYVAHFVTLWLQASGTPVSTAAAAAKAGLARGILTSKAADGLSMGFQALSGFEDWGAWALTAYGQLLITQAKVIGSGSAWLY